MHMPMFDSPMWWSLITRITHSRHRKLFFFFALLQCLVQVLLRTIVLGEDIRAVNLVTTVFDRLPATDPVRTSIPVLDDGALLGCTGPADFPGRTCSIVIVPSFSMMGSNGTPNPSIVIDSDTRKELVKGLKKTDQPITFDEQCQHAMILPNAIFTDALREDTTLTAFQLWLFVLAMAGLLQDSIPHMAAHLGGQTINTAWAAFRISSLLKWRDMYTKYVARSACEGVDILEGTWKARIAESSVILTTNVILLIFTAYLSVRLIMNFMEATYDRVGASPKIAQAHKWALAFSMSLNGGFFLFATLALWLSKIGALPLRGVTPCSHAHLVVASIALAMVPLWMLMGWRSICLECLRRFVAFCVLSCAFLAIFVAMFASPVYHNITAIWPFFGAISIASFVFLLAALILGLVCRFYFGRGLAHFLEVQAILARENFAVASFTYNSGQVSQNGHASFIYAGNGVNGLMMPAMAVDTRPSSMGGDGSLYEELGMAKKPLFLLGGDASKSKDGKDLKEKPNLEPISFLSMSLDGNGLLGSANTPALRTPPRAAFNPSGRRTTYTGPEGGMTEENSRKYLSIRTPSMRG